MKDGNNVDFAKKKATAIPTNPRITLPKQTNEKVEIEMRNLTGRLRDTFKKYREENSNDKGRMKTDKLTKEERAGLKEAKESGNVFSVTDKSKEFSVDTPDNYLKSMEKHTEKDKQLTDKEHAKTDRELNGHKVMWARFLRVGEDWGHQARVKSAIITKSGSSPKLKGLRKTHKPVEEGKEQEGPEQRPVCMAKRSPN